MKARGIKYGLVNSNHHRINHSKVFADEKNNFNYGIVARQLKILSK